MKTVSDLMVRRVKTLELVNTMQDAHNLMRKHGIRHIPILNEKRLYAGLLMQKQVLAKGIALLQQVGMENLKQAESQISVTQLMLVDAPTILPQTPLDDAAAFFMQNSNGCLPVVDEQGLLKGIITSSDFVRLARELLVLGSTASS